MYKNQNLENMDNLRYQEILRNVPDVVIRIKNITTLYKREKEIEKNNPKYEGAGWVQLIKNERPPFLKGKNNEWRKFVTLWKKENANPKGQTKLDLK